MLMAAARTTAFLHSMLLSGNPGSNGESDAKREWNMKWKWKLGLHKDSDRFWGKGDASMMSTSCVVAGAQVESVLLTALPSMKSRYLPIDQQPSVFTKEGILTTSTLQKQALMLEACMSPSP